MGIDGQKRAASARGEVVDFDLLLIKQQLADAPQNIEVARRQEFIDNKEQGKSKKKTAVKSEPTPTFEMGVGVPVVGKSVSSTDFENENGDAPAGVKKEVKPEPVIERPSKK